ncbi:MAG: oligosaccharide flippase family protein [Rhabdochlamydiaceae bacterium]|nr:oligosaccharide flippase family protein [Rhabdochlamydiaceae bacterium]
MASVKKNLAANLLGKIWVILVSAIFTPIYIKLIGIEAYGIVGIYTALTMIFSLLDLGLQPTVNRELARLSADPHLFEKHSGNVIRTLEWVYWPMAIAIGAIVFFVAPFISNEWVHAKDLAPETIKQAIYCIGLALAFQWPMSLYHGSLMGLQRHVILNVIFVGISTLKGIGMIFVLMYVSPTIQAFFIWQISLNALQTGLMAFVVWKNLPQSSHWPRFDMQILNHLKGFALGITSTGALTIMLSQIDKVILSKMLSLEMFSYYALASMLAATLSYVSGGVLTTYYPQFSKQVAMHDCGNPQQGQILSHIYHNACQVLSIIIIPMALMAVFFSWELLYVWTQNEEISNYTYLTMSLLTLASLLNGLIVLPYAMQLAHGWTKLNVYQNAAGLVVMVPLMIAGVFYLGGVGAALTGVVVNLGVMAISIFFMHKKILVQERRKWITHDVLYPMGASLSVILIARFLIPLQSMHIFLKLFVLLLVFALSVMAAIFAAPLVRKGLMTRLRKKKGIGLVDSF